MSESDHLRLAQARLLLEASAEAMLVVDERGGILYANAVAARLFGYEPEALGALDVEQLVPVAIRGKHAALRASYVGKPYPRAMGTSERIHARRSDGEEFPVEISLSPLELEGRPVVVAAVVDMSERVEREAAVHAANELNRQIIASAREGIIVFDREGRYRLWNPFMESLTGIAEEDCVGRFPHEVFPFLEDVGVAGSIRRALAGETVRNPPFRWTVPQSGRTGWAESIQTPLRDRRGDVVGVVDIVRDITEARRAQEEQELAATVYRAIGEAIFVADAGNRIIAVNPAFTGLTGYSEKEAVGQSTSLLRSDHHPDAFYRDMWLAVESTGHWQGEIWNRHKDGEVRHEWLAITTVFDEDGEVLQRIGALSDITERKRAAQSIWQQGSRDALTTLPNRRMFRDCLAQELEGVDGRQGTLALLFLDIDRFKEVNDTFGHDRGDLLLKEVARRLGDCIRDSDTVARLGGDEFTVILAGVGDRMGAERVVHAIQRSLRATFSLEPSAINVTASIGIALAPSDGATVEELVKHADLAMYEAKRAGRNCYRFHSERV